MAKQPIPLFVNVKLAEGKIRPAIVVNKGSKKGTLNVQVFTDGDGNLVGDRLPALLWKQDVAPGDGVGQWTNTDGTAAAVEEEAPAAPSGETSSNPPPAS